MECSHLGVAKHFAMGWTSGFRAEVGEMEPTMFKHAHPDPTTAILDEGLQGYQRGRDGSVASSVSPLKHAG